MATCVLSVSVPLAFATTATTSTVVTPPPRVHNAAAVEQAVRSSFTDVPAMIEIARCESKFRQYTDSGNAFRGGYNNAMIGVFQFNEPVHARTALSLGYDLATLEGNLGYARHVYGLSGTDPWVSSYSCWNSATKTNVGFSPVVFGQSSDEVRTLQQLLNAAGYTVAASGPGSSGNETTMFGTLTRVALRQFQCDVMDICSGNEHATGYGLYDAKTRDALMAFKKPKTENTLSPERRAALLKQIAALLKQVEALQAQLKLLRSA